MDLMKLLKAKSDHLLSQQSRSDTIAANMITDLKIQFETFLRDISQLDEFRQSNPLNGVKCIAGEILLEDEYGVLGKSPYLFLRIPGHPGLLLEVSHSDHLVLFIATEARPIKRRWNGEQSSQVVFVRRPHPLGQFVVLEPDVVRNLSNQQTLIGIRLFEHLVETLITHISPTPLR